VILRPYQQEALDCVFQEWQTLKRTLLVLPTGTGKTIVFSHITKTVVANGGRVLILAHRGELLTQAADKLQQATGLATALEKADATSHDALERVTVGSVQSLMHQSRLDRFDPAHFSHIIIDEAHHAVSDSYQRAIEYFTNAHVLGVTATADRADKKSLSLVFDSLAFEYSLGQAVKDGFLAPIRILTLPIKIDVSEFSTGGKEPSAEQCATALDPYIPALAEGFAEQCRTRKGLVFVPLCATGQKVQKALASQGLDAYYCSGEDRSQIADWERAGKGSVMVNSMLLTEGYDHPPLDLIAVWRFTKSRSFYAQMVGRGTRLSPGKENLLILDNLYLGDNLALSRPASLIAEDEEIEAALNAMADAKPGVEIDMLSEEELAEAHQRVIEEREKSLAEKLEKMRHRKHKLVDPLQWEMSVGAEDLISYQPQFANEAAPATKDQLKQIEKAGILPDEIKSKGEAARILARINQRKADGCAQPRQIRCLEKYGYKNVGQMNFADAHRMITRIAANGWRIPHDIMPAKINMQHANKEATAHE